MTEGQQEPVAWRILCTINGATGYLYTEALPFDPGYGVRVRREPEPLYAAPQPADSAPARSSVPAEVREALQECIDTLQLVEHPSWVDPLYGEEVKRLGDRIGYGALMSSASASWREKLAREGSPVGGEFVAGPCHIHVLIALNKARKALSTIETTGE